MSIKETLTKYLVGRRITAATDATLTLDDGTAIRLYESHYDRCAAQQALEVLDATD